ncbi:hypothetical protein ACIBBG_33550 [Micromonospora chersina]|uniref:hypothetical protein n=1 Tax=Micromonospora chersina TaxID=47854 RepID=UPI0037B0F20F
MSSEQAVSELVRDWIDYYLSTDLIGAFGRSPLNEIHWVSFQIAWLCPRNT